MHTSETIERVAVLIRLRHITPGRPSVSQISRRTGVSRDRVNEWQSRGFASVIASRQKACGDGCESREDLPGALYAYLLGLYLGDGCISRGRGRVHVLRVTLDDRYPGIIEECRVAMEAVLPNRVWTVARPGCTEVASASIHWPCLFPQHGQGRKHHRRIILEEWQESIALSRWPGLFVRGLIHSDGWRGINPVVRPVGRTRKRYEYSRYQFTNLSPDIRGLFSAACAALGVESRQANHKTISVARRASVAVLDQHVGSKQMAGRSELLRRAGVGAVV